MTRDEILAMPAGIEMDVLIATKVMGWKRYVNTAWSSFAQQRDGAEQVTWVEGDLNTFRASDDWSPSTDISAAWEVVYKLHPDHSIQIDFDDPETVEEIKWYCGLYTKGEPFRDYEARADTAPLAICRAALLTVIEKS